MPIRARLTLWYVLLLGMVLVVFSALLYFVLSYTLRNEVDRALQDRARQVRAGIVAANPPTDILRTGVLQLPQIDVFSSPSVYIEVIDANGKVKAKSAELGGEYLPINDDLMVAIRQGQPIYHTFNLNNGAHLRVFSQPLIVGTSVVGAIVVGQTLTDVENTLNSVLFFLTGGTVATLILASLMGVVFAWAALRPIDAISRTAERIVTAQDLDQRLPTLTTTDELARLTNTINAMLERLNNFFQAQVRLSADISHELRTPLTTIRGNIDLLRRGPASDPAELDESLTIIDSELDRMERIVNDLLLLSQADAGMSLRMRTVELDTIVLDVYRQARSIADGVNVNLGHEDQAVIEGDPDRLKQLLLNLVHNALKHTPPGGDVTISLYRETDWVRVSVADTGSGIAPEDLPHIFDRFYRGRRQNHRGTGLGLSIANWIAEEHCGQITVESTLGEGSTFTVWLPREKDPAQTRPSRPRTLP